MFDTTDLDQIIENQFRQARQDGEKITVHIENSIRSADEDDSESNFIRRACLLLSEIERCRTLGLQLTPIGKLVYPESVSQSIYYWVCRRFHSSNSDV